MLNEHFEREQMTGEGRGVCVGSQTQVKSKAAHEGQGENQERDHSTGQVAGGVRSLLRAGGRCVLCYPGVGGGS